MRPDEAAIAIASRFGLSVAAPVVLSDSNNVVLWLRPAPVVAKVATGHYRRLAVELAVAKHLLIQGAPIVAPADDLPQEVHHLEDWEVTFWTYQPHGRNEPDPADLGGALCELHEALLSYQGPLPSYGDELSVVAEVLTGTGRIAALPAADRQLLASALSHFLAKLEQLHIEERPLHGSPHSGNLLVVDDAVRFLDFETACVGPLEWDLAHVGDEVVRHYPARVNSTVLSVCRALVSVKTATWCWAKFEHPALRWHAKHHLRVVKRLIADRTSIRRLP
jgi:Ser/Thr protein kinase RdoA (MazF antagonist)